MSYRSRNARPQIEVATWLDGQGRTVRLLRPASSKPDRTELYTRKVDGDPAGPLALGLFESEASALRYAKSF